MFWGVLALIAILTAAHWVILAARLPVFTELQWWFWKFSEQSLDAWWLLLPLSALAALALWVALRWRAPAALRLTALVVLGFGWQQGLGLLEGRGLDGLRDQIVWTGHAQFARAAARQQGIAEVVRDYEELAPREVHGKYAKSKPPGTLLLYVLSERAASGLPPWGAEVDRLERLQDFATWTWPLVSYLVLIPMAIFARRYLDPHGGHDLGLLAACLYLFVPSVSLMALHTDQTFYPLFAMGGVLLAALASERGSAALALAAGVWLYLALFCSFGLLVVVPLAGAVALALARADAGSGPALDAPRLARVGLGVLAGCVATDLLLRFGLDYDIAVRYRSAMAHHLAWKFGWEWSLSNVAYVALIDALETVVWLGVPLAAAAGAEAVSGLRRAFSERLAPAPVFAAAVAAVFLALLFLSRTKGEAARLWLFMVPFACLLAAGRLQRLAPGRGWLLPAFVALQVVTVFLTKAHQDF